MSFFKKAKHAAIARRVLEEKFYEQALKEIETGRRRDGLWAKALQKSKGNDGETQALYIQYCVQALKDEAEILAAPQADPPALPNKWPSGNPLDAYDANGYTPLMQAVKTRDVEAVINLVSRGANPHIVDRDWGTSTALDIAKLELNRTSESDMKQSLRQIVSVLIEAQQR